VGVSVEVCARAVFEESRREWEEIEQSDGV
jgi:hypothetical protein